MPESRLTIDDVYSGGTGPGVSTWDGNFLGMSQDFLVTGKERIYEKEGQSLLILRTLVLVKLSTYGFLYRLMFQNWQKFS